MKKKINDGAHIKYTGITPTGFVKKNPTNPGWGRYDWDDNEFEDMVKELLVQYPDLNEETLILNSIKDYANLVGARIMEDDTSNPSSILTPSILTTPSSSSSSSPSSSSSISTNSSVDGKKNR